LQQAKLSTAEGDPAAMNNTINNLDENDDSSPESSPRSPRDQMFDTNPPYSQVLICYVLRTKKMFLLVGQCHTYCEVVNVNCYNCREL
jgi:hypothetical protein